MFSSVFTHIVLVISCVIFLLSFVRFINRIQTHHTLYRSETFIINHYDESPIQSSTVHIPRKTHSDEPTNERVRRENVLGSNKTYETILDRLTFIEPPEPACIYPKETQHFMLILVLSRGLNFDYRQSIRATWGRTQKYKRNNIYVKTLFFVGTDDSVQLAIRDEQRTFNDVIEIGKKIQAKTCQNFDVLFLFQ